MRGYLKILVTALAVPAATVALVACGGSDDGASSADEKEVADAIVTSVTTSDPANCIELETLRFVEQIEFEKGDAAIESCKKNDGSDATGAEVTSIEIDGDAATAEVSIAGASFDGQTVKVSLIKKGGKWKLDHLEEFTSFDRDAFLAAFEKSFTTGENAATPAQGKCILDAIEPKSDEELQSLFLSGDQNQLIAVLGLCFNA